MWRLPEAAQAEAFEHVVHLDLLGLRAPRQPPSALGHEEALGHGDREVPVHRLDLRHVAGGELRTAHHGAVHRLDRAHEEPQQRGLAGAGRPDDAGEGSLGHVQVHVVEDQRFAVGAARTLHLDQRHCG
jgi:hypothetical protein